MKISFRQFNSIVTLPEDTPTEQVDEMFGAFFGGKEEAEKKKEELLKQRAKLLDLKAAKRKEISKKKDEIFAKRANELKFNDAYGPSNKEKVPKDWIPDLTNESKKFSSPVQDILQKIVDGDLEIYQVMNHPEDDDQKKAAKYLQTRYDDIASDRGFHRDDDFEEIENELFDELEDEFKD